MKGHPRRKENSYFGLEKGYEHREKEEGACTRSTAFTYGYVQELLKQRTFNETNYIPFSKATECSCCSSGRWVLKYDDSLRFKEVKSFLYQMEE